MIKFIYAYMAGYIDGDGCFYIAKQYNKRKTVIKYPVATIISSSDEKIINLFSKFFKGSKNKAKQKIIKHKIMHYFQIRKYESIKLINNIFPYLVEKKEEANTFINFINCIDKQKKESLFKLFRLNKHTKNLISNIDKEEIIKFKNTINPSIDDFAYLAGFIDAECCFTINKYKPKTGPNFAYKISLQVNNTRKPIFKWLIQRFGGQINFINKRRHSQTCNNQLSWKITGKALSKIINNIYPFLKYKKPVCKELMRFYNTTLPNGGDRHSKQFKVRYAKVISVRESIVNKVHKLNLKGNIT